MEEHLGGVTEPLAVLRFRGLHALYGSGGNVPEQNLLAAYYSRRLTSAESMPRHYRKNIFEHYLFFVDLFDVSAHGYFVLITIVCLFGRSALTDHAHPLARSTSKLLAIILRAEACFSIGSRMMSPTLICRNNVESSPRFSWQIIVLSMSIYLLVLGTAAGIEPAFIHYHLKGTPFLENH